MAGGSAKAANGSSDAAAAAVPASTGQAAETAPGSLLRGGAGGASVAGTAAEQAAGVASDGRAQAAQQGALPSGGAAASVGDGSGSIAAAVGQASTAILLNDASMAASQVGARRRQRQQRLRTLLAAERFVERWRGSLRQTLQHATDDLQLKDKK